MMIIRPEAEEDIRETFEWYKSKYIKLGSDFLEEIEWIFQRIEEYPDMFPKVYIDLQRALVRRFPYAVYFKQNNDEIIVVGVLHQRRNPAAWQKRFNA